VNNPLASLAVAAMTAVTLLCFAGYQVTGDTAGPRLLGRLAASLVELERWVPSHRDDIDLLARDRLNENIVIDDLPVDIVVRSQDVLALGENDPAMTALLRDAMGRRLYDEGRGALQGEAGETHLGVTDPVRWAVTMLSADMHSTWRLALIASALVTALFAGSFLLSRRSPLGPMAAGAGVAAVVSFFAWLIAGGADSLVDSAVDKEIVMIFGDAAWLALRNSLAVCAVLLALLFLYRALVAPRLREDEDEYYYWPELDDAQDSYSADSV
jgi:hypothetical protein